VRRSTIKARFLDGRRVPAHKNCGCRSNPARPGQGWGEWLYHPQLKPAQEQIDADFLAALPAIHTALEQEGAKKREQWRRTEQTELDRLVQEYGRAAEQKQAEARRQQGFLFD
jgi:hypothetical protein